MRRVTLPAPFTGGMVTDVPAHALGPEHSSYAQDGFSPQGVFKQRQGWAYDGTTADVADNLVSVYRAQFILADTTRTVTVDDDGDMFIHNPAGAGTNFYNSTVAAIPRCVYRDELMICFQDGLTPMRRYSGASMTADVTTTGTGQVAANTSRHTAGTAYSSAPPVGSFFVGRLSDAANDFPVWIRVLESDVTGTDYATLEDLYSTATESYLSSSLFQSTGLIFPAVGIYSAGTVTVAGGAGDVTGVGTKWSTGGLTLLAGNDAILVSPVGADAQILRFNSVTDDDTLASVTGGNGSAISTGAPYQITRRGNFKDAAAHKGSLWGTGVAQYPSRVYVFPPGWNPSYPPGYSLPFNPTENWTSPNPNDYLADFIDVPSSYDGDDNVAILSSPNPLLVLKRTAVYGVYGSYPNFSVDMIADGIGCIDIRSAHSYDEGQFWAGEGGIYWYTGGQIIDLTAGRINREWRALTRDFDYGTSDYCSLAVASGHLVVHITTGGGVTQRTFLCDLRDRSWQSRISNFTPRYMHTSRIPGEKEKLLAVSDARQGRVLDFAPALDGSGTAADDAGSAPRLAFHSTSGLARAGGIEGLTRFVDLDVHANVYDAGAAGSTVLSLSTVHGGGPSNEADATKTLTAINSDTADRIDRHSRRIGRRGRLHQVRGEVTTLGTDSNATKIEVHEIVATVRDNRSRA